MRPSTALLAALALLLSGPASAAKDYEKMSAEQLMTLHLGDKDNVDRPALKEALRRQLEPLSTERLHALLQRISAPTICVDFVYPPLADRIGPNTIVVLGRVERTEITRESLIQNILEKSRDGFGLEIELTVLRQYPEQPARERVLYRTGVGHEYVGFVSAGREYVFIFQDRNGQLSGGGVTQAYHVTPEGKVWNVLSTGGELPLEEAWAIVRNRGDLARGTLSDETLRSWKEKLNGGDLAQCAAALDFLAEVKPTVLTAADVAGALERQHAALRPLLQDTHPFAQPPDLQEQTRLFQAFARKALGLLATHADPAATNSAYRLYVQDVSSNMTPLLKPEIGEQSLDVAIVRLVGATPSPDRRARLEALFTGNGAVRGEGGQTPYTFIENHYHAFQALADPPAEDIDAFLLDVARDPHRYGITQGHELASAWTALARHGNATLKAEWERLAAANPPASDYGLTDPSTDPRMGPHAQSALQTLAESLPEDKSLAELIKQCKSGNTSAAFAFCRRVTPGNPAAVALLQDVDLAPFASTIAEKLPDPSLAPGLRDALKKGLDIQILRALEACGDRESVTRAARDWLASPLVAADAAALSAQIGGRTYCMTWANTTADKALSDVVAEYVIGDRIDDLYKAAETLFTYEKDDQGRRAYINSLRGAAMAAYAACAGQEAIPKLRRVYKENDARLRASAAWVLQALGDDTGADLVQAYAERRPEFPGLLMVPMAVRSHQTDALLLERLEAGIANEDAWLFNRQWQPADNPTVRFTKDYEREILIILRRHLDSPDLRTANSAMQALAHITGERFGCNEDGTWVGEGDPLPQWKQYLDGRLSAKP